jgi:hypothetical protein
MQHVSIAEAPMEIRAAGGTMTAAHVRGATSCLRKIAARTVAVVDPN